MHQLSNTCLPSPSNSNTLCFQRDNVAETDAVSALLYSVTVCECSLNVPQKDTPASASAGAPLDDAQGSSTCEESSDDESSPSDAEEPVHASSPGPGASIAPVMPFAARSPEELSDDAAEATVTGDATELTIASLEATTKPTDTDRENVHEAQLRVGAEMTAQLQPQEVMADDDLQGERIPAAQPRNRNSRSVALSNLPSQPTLALSLNQCRTNVSRSEQARCVCNSVLVTDGSDPGLHECMLAHVFFVRI